MARNIECQCEPSFTCGYCLRNAKPYFFTPSTNEEQMARAIARPAREWFVGSNGNHFCDMGGFRYCVEQDQRDNEGWTYSVSRNGDVLHTRIPSLGAAQMLASSDARVHETFA